MAGAGAAQMSQQALQQTNSLGLVKEKMTQVSTILGEVAGVLSLTKPTLMEPLKIMAQAGSAIMNEISQSSGAPPSGDGIPQAQMPVPQDAAGAVSMS